MKRKSPTTTHHLPAPVRIVRPRIEIVSSLEQQDDDITDAASASISAVSSSGSTAVEIAGIAATAHVLVDETDATSLSSDASNDDNTDLSMSEETASDSSSDSSSDSDASDTDTQETQTSQDLMPPSSAATTVYQHASTGLTTVRIGRKPVIDAGLVRSSGSLVKRLERLLPALQESNRVLDGEVADGSIARRIIGVQSADAQESSDDDEAAAGPEGADEGYIEMSLGLGVLEEHKDASEVTSTVESTVAQRLFGARPLAEQRPAIHDIYDADIAMQ